MSAKYLGQPFDVHCGCDRFRSTMKMKLRRPWPQRVSRWRAIGYNEFLLIDGGRMENLR